MRDGVDNLIWEEKPTTGISSVALINTPMLLKESLTTFSAVKIFCDDYRDAAYVDSVAPSCRVNTPTNFGDIDCVLMRLPKSLGELEEYAGAFQSIKGLSIIAGGRIKYMNRSMNSVLSKYFTEVSASRGRFKARVLHAQEPRLFPSPWPKVRHHKDLGFSVVAHGGTFAGTKIDSATQLLITSLDSEAASAGASRSQVLDYGCGNGALSIWLARHNCSVSARDVSWAAVDATRLAGIENHVPINVTWGNGLAGYEPCSFDYLITNPPFHRGTTKDTTDTLNMFHDAARVIRPGGQMWVVFNSHLPYLRELRQKIGETQIVARNARYTVTVSVVS